MTDYDELRRLATKAKRYADEDDLPNADAARRELNRAANPATVIALLDEIDTLREALEQVRNMHRIDKSAWAQETIKVGELKDQLTYERGLRKGDETERDNALADLATANAKADEKEGQLLQLMHAHEDLRSSLAQQAERSERAEAEVAVLTDRLGRVKALADKWQNKDFRTNVPAHNYVGLDWAAADLRAAISDGDGQAHTDLFGFTLSEAIAESTDDPAGTDGGNEE